jgi:hypothetical protein
MKVGEIEQRVVDNNALTDEAIDELTLKMAFLMSHIQIAKPVNGGLADATGRVQVERKPAMLVYLEMRPALIAGREQIRNAQNLQTESATDGDETTGLETDFSTPINGEAHTSADTILDDAEDRETKH